MDPCSSLFLIVIRIVINAVSVYSISKIGFRVKVWLGDPPVDRVSKITNRIRRML